MSNGNDIPPEDGLWRPTARMPEAGLGDMMPDTDYEYVLLQGMWCGQGMAHLVKLYDNEEDVPAALLMFDFGGGGSELKQSKKALGMSPPVKTLIDTLEYMMEHGKDPRIELFMISHQDRDHWSFLSEFLDAVKTRDIPLEVGKVVLGGVRWGKTASKTVKALGAYTADPKTCVLPYGTNATNYANPLTPPTVSVSFGNVRLRTIIANTPSATSSDALIKNGSSAVVVLEMNGDGFLLPGDATYETLAKANQLLSGWSANPLPSVFMMSAPHHGSLTTITRRNRGQNSDFTELKAFVDYVRANANFASAGTKNSHKHPYLVVLDVLNKYVGTNGYGTHDYVGFDVVNRKWKVIEDVNINCYTSTISLTSPVRTATWDFGFDDNYRNTTAKFYDAGVPAVISVPTTDDDSMEIEISDDEDDDTLNSLATPGTNLFRAARAGQPADRARVDRLHSMTQRSFVHGLNREGIVAERVRMAASRHAPPPRRVQPVPRAPK
ncbi:hypothetical protein [Tistrella mobilis]